MEMAIRQKGKGKDRGNAEAKAKLKGIAAESAALTKIAIHNSFMALVFGLAMLLSGLASIEIAYAVVGLAIGNAGAGSLSTVADLVVVLVTIAMACGLLLFFAFKIENALIAGLRRRLWRYDKGSGEVIKPSMAVAAKADAREERDGGTKDAADGDAPIRMNKPNRRNKR